MGNIVPWGETAVNYQKINEYKKLRQERIDAVRKRLKSSSERSEENARLKILDLSLLELRDALQKEEISAEAALDAYVWRALNVHKKLNCAAEFLIEAFDEARKLDKIWHGNISKPPLFGIPFSVKSNFFIKGYDCSLGLAKYLFKPANVDCSFITHLRSLGAVPFVTTSVPQALLSYVCSSVIYGTTGNPHNVKKIPGGSSGGECALCAAGGCAFGTGSDLAGSLRIPASLCGVVTLKPTEARFIVRGAYSGFPGRGRLGLSYGYFTRTTEEQKFLLKYTFGSKNYVDIIPQMVALHLDDERIKSVEEKKLRIGYYTDDGFLTPVPACSRVVIETVDKLESLGHELIHFQVPKSQQAAKMFFKNIMPDGGDLVNSHYSCEPLSPYIKVFAFMVKVPVWIRWLVGWLLKTISPQLSTMCLSSLRTLSDLRKNQEATDKYIEMFTKQWLSMDLDALVCPAFPVPAIPHKYPSRMSFCVFSTGLYNMLDFPSGVVPVGYVNKEDDDKLADESEWPCGRNPALKLMRESAKKSAGMPLGVQIVGLPFHEEECLAVMGMVEKLFKEQ